MTKYNDVLVVISLLLALVATNSVFAACENVPDAVIDLIEQDLAIEDAVLGKKSARMIKSADFQNIYFIAARIQPKDSKRGGDIGLWASNSMEAGKGMMFSVNSTALSSTNWPNGKQSPLRLSKKSRGARKAIACVKKTKDS